MSQGTKEEEVAAVRDKAGVQQQRRLKQATQFTHKDSADLLPLDGLKRMGTSKDLQPHNIVQRRLLEGNITRLRGEARDPGPRVRSPLADSKEGSSGGGGEERSDSTADDSAEERESPEESERSLRSDEEDEEEDSSEATAAAAISTPLVALVVQCKCCETDVKASINTGCQHNHISPSCCQRLGLVPSQDSATYGLTSTVRDLQLQLGRQTIQCSAIVTEDEASELCLGLQTLLELKCCVDLGSRVVKLQGSGEELPFLGSPCHTRCRHDTNENL